MLMPELVAYLQSYTPSLGLTGGTNLFYGMMPPDQPDLCVALYEYGSVAPEVQVGGSVVNIENSSVQVVVRGAKEDYDTPRLLLNKILSAFVKVQDATLSGVRYSAILPKQSPFLLDTDDNLRRRFACNFTIMKDWSDT